MPTRGQTDQRERAKLLVALLVCTCALFCSQRAFAETSQPLTYHEAPELAALVAAGKLPPVAERLPENPAVVPPVERIGKYGGAWRTLAGDGNDLQMNFRNGYEPLLRWDRSGRNVIPGVAESYEVQENGRTYVFHLRKGMKWSDGHLLTSEDFVFVVQDIMPRIAICGFPLNWIKVNGELPKCDAPDPLTVVYRFPAPYGAFPQTLACQGVQRQLFMPKHYLTQFLDTYTSVSVITAIARKSGFVQWQEFFMRCCDHNRNPDLPTVAPFHLRNVMPAAVCVAVRNPYYWKVDPEGNQLPYLDEIRFTMVFDTTILNLKAMNGEVDFQMRRIDSGNFTLFREKGRELGYRTLLALSTNPVCVFFNQWSTDPEIRPILQDRHFRQALAFAINRKEVVDLIYTGLAEPSGGFIVPEDPYYLPEFGKANTQYDPAKSNSLLDEIGMKRGADGFRRFPDGKPFHRVIEVCPSEEGINADLWQLVVDYWRDIGLQFTLKFLYPTLAYQEGCSGNWDFWGYANASLHWGVDGAWKVPLANFSYMAPLNGLYYQTQGRRGEKPDPEMQHLVDLFTEMRATGNEQRRLELGHVILKQWADECYVAGIARSPLVAIIANRFRNVPEKFVYDYQLKSPGYMNIEQFFIDENAK